MLVRATYNGELQVDWADLAAAAVSATLPDMMEMTLPCGREWQARLATLALYPKQIVLPAPAAHCGRYLDRLSVVSAY